MQPTFTTFARRIVVAFGSGAVLAAGSTLAAPAAQAYTSLKPTITSPGYDVGNALTVGAQFFLSAPAASSAVNVGGRLSGAMGALDYGPAAPVNFIPNWYSCPAANSAIANCTLASEGQTYVGSAANRAFPYVAKAADMGRYLRFAMIVRATTLGIQGSVTELSEPSSSILVLPGASRTTAPTWAAAVAGASTTLQLNAWTPGGELTFGSRSLIVYRCTSAGAGQVSTASFSTSGCTTLANAVRTTVSGAGATAVTVDVPADAAGAYLLAQDTATFRTAGGYTAVTVARSGTAAVSTPGATPTPSATPSTDPSASTAPATPSGPENPSAQAPAGEMSLSLAARAAVTRGSNFRVTLNLSQKAAGEAKMAIKKRPTARAASLQRLKVVDVVGGTGTRVNRVSTRLAKGAYYLVAVYTDDVSGAKRLVTKPITIK